MSVDVTACPRIAIGMQHSVRVRIEYLYDCFPLAAILIQHGCRFDSVDSSAPSLQLRRAKTRTALRAARHRELGGDGRIRTADGGFADPCLATWLRRRRW